MQDYRFLDIVRRGEEEEVLAYFPERNTMIKPMKERYGAFCALHDELCGALRANAPASGDWTRAIVEQRLQDTPKADVDVVLGMLQRDCTCQELASDPENISTQELHVLLKPFVKRKPKKEKEKAPAVQSAATATDVDPESNAPAKAKKKGKKGAGAGVDDISMAELDVLLQDFASGKNAGQGKKHGRKA